MQLARSAVIAATALAAWLPPALAQPDAPFRQEHERMLSSPL